MNYKCVYSCTYVIKGASNLWVQRGASAPLDFFNYRIYVITVPSRTLVLLRAPPDFQNFDRPWITNQTAYWLYYFSWLFKGHSGIISRNKLSHIAELDLTDNLMSEWSEICALLKMFPGLEFLNLSNNLLTPSAEFLLSVSSKMNHGLRKLGRVELFLFLLSVIFNS